MNKNPIKQVALILLFFLVFGINAEDISITYDPTYFNPLAVSFKWDVKFNKKLDADHPVMVQYELYDVQVQHTVFYKKNIMRISGDSLSIYLFITELEDEKSGPLIRIETIPSQEVITFNVKGCKFSNSSILFSGKQAVKSQLSDMQNLLRTNLILGNSAEVKEGWFSKMYLPYKGVAVCNLCVNFSVKFDLSKRTLDQVGSDPEQSK